MRARVLLVDDEADMLQTCLEALEGIDAEVGTEGSAERALERIRAERFNLVVSDIKMPGLDGIELMRATRKDSPDTGVILITAYPRVETAVEALRLGAVDYLVKPFHPEALRNRVERALRERLMEEENALLARQVERPYQNAPILGRSPALLEALRVLDRIAPLPTEVLLLGESGTGKELAARRLHARSGRKGRFVPLDCGAIPEQLLENELFGHEKGAYTDARGSSSGLLEFADRGTLFMDEVCEIQPALQAKLLRTLQERQFRRIGSQRLISVDVRVLAATNRDIEAEVREGRFRADLYYRINSVQVRLPPLRERPGDVPALAAEFAARCARELGRQARAVSPEAMAVLDRYRWPGNVRELENAIKRAVALAEGERIELADLPEAVVLGQEEEPEGGGFIADRNRLLDRFEGRYFRGLMARFPKDAKAAAAQARIPLSTFYRFLKKHRLP